jgi:hypothetical protein
MCVAKNNKDYIKSSGLDLIKVAKLWNGIATIIPNPNPTSLNFFDPHLDYFN